jgi:hypothetical protein
MRDIMLEMLRLHEIKRKYSTRTSVPTMSDVFVKMEVPLYLNFSARIYNTRVCVLE